MFNVEKDNRVFSNKLLNLMFYSTVLIMMRGISFILILFFSVTNVTAQTPEIGVFGGGAYYIGDLNPYAHFNQTNYSVGVVYRSNFDNERVALRIQAIYGKVAGNDAMSSDVNQLNRNLNFSSSVLEIGPLIEINFIDYIVGEMSRKKFKFQTFYLLAGITYFKMNPLGTYQGEAIELQPLATEGQETSQNPSQSRYQLNQISIPLGLGYKFNISKRFAISLEYGIRKTFTDYLDDVSGRYPDLQLLSVEAGQLSAYMSDRTVNEEGYTELNYGMSRGNSKNKDWYSFFGAVISFRIFDHETCSKRFK